MFQKIIDDFFNSHFAVFVAYLLPSLNEYRLFIKLLVMKKGTIEYMAFVGHRLLFQRPR